MPGTGRLEKRSSWGAMETLVNTLTQSTETWLRRVGIRSLDSLSDVDGLKNNVALWVVRVQVLLGDNLTAVGRAIQSRLGS
jgi:hypothetical protein